MKVNWVKVLLSNLVHIFREKTWLIKTAVKRWEMCWKILHRENAGEKARLKSSF